MIWNKKDRMNAVVRGEVADRAPISAWRHFPGMEETPEDLARAMSDFQDTYDWDYMKINPRAVYYHEVWGNEYDYSVYQDVLPTLVKKIVNSPEDLGKITRQPSTAAPLAQQVDAVKLLKARYGDSLPMFQTVFTPIGILLNLCGQRSLGRYRESPREESALVDLMAHHSQAVHSALKAIAETLADYAHDLVSAGVDGAFYAALGMAREGYMTLSEWEEFVKPYDLIALEPLRGKINCLHTCGIYGNPQRFTDYPIQILHWAESAPGNPKIAEARSWLGNIVPMGGVDERFFGTGGETQIAAMSRASLKMHKGKPFIMAPECSVSVKTLDSELKTFRSSVA
ncbi:MAG: hypothetical protein DELT_01992 [Desulfovibrio sp.]